MWRYFLYIKFNLKVLLNSNNIIDYIFGITIERRFTEYPDNFLLCSGVGFFWEELKKGPRIINKKNDNPVLSLEKVLYANNE
jgi:hypothetical protein